MKKSQTLRLTLTAVVIAIIIIMAYFPQIGFIYIVPEMVAITFILIPVCVAAIVLGKYYGFAAGACFGIMSLVMSYLRPAAGNLLFQYPWVSILPRLFIGPAVYFAHKFFKRLFEKSKNRYVKDFLPLHFAATCGVLTNTALVYICAYSTMILMPALETVPWAFLLGLYSINMSLEILAVNLLVPPICAALRKAGFDKKVANIANITNQTEPQSDAADMKAQKTDAQND